MKPLAARTGRIATSQTVAIDAKYKKLKAEGMVSRDSRSKERKKYGQKGARKRFQYSKR